MVTDLTSIERKNYSLAFNSGHVAPENKEFKTVHQSSFARVNDFKINMPDSPEAK